MTWPDLLDVALRILADCPTLQGFAIRRSGEIHQVHPETIAYRVIATPEGDGWIELHLQLDLWGRDYPAVVAVEMDVRAELNRPVDFLGPLGFRLTSEVQDSDDGEDAEPGAAHRRLDVTLRAAARA